MIKKWVLMGALLYGATNIVAAATVSLSGTVTDSLSAGVVGARVSLKNNPQIMATTDAAGGFLLTGTVESGIASSDRAVQAAFPLRYTGSGLEFRTVSSGLSATVTLYTVDGSRISTVSLNGLSAGTHTVPLVPPRRGLYSVYVTLGGDSYTMKIMAGIGTAVRGGDGFDRAAGKTAASYEDTLVVVARGYRNVLAGLDGYEAQDLGVVLAPSEPWQPDGALTYAGNMVRIMAAGTDFEMGQADPDVWGDQTSLAEQPVHTVRFTRDFWMDTTEVTQADYDSIMQGAYSEYGTGNEYWKDEYGLGDRYPAYFVQWGDAVLYCNARSKLEHLDTVYNYTRLLDIPGKLCLLEGVEADLSKNGYRLPTEAEWEYACRAGSATDYFWGKNMAEYPATPGDTAEIGSYAVWQVNAWDKGLGTPGFGVNLVAQKLPNAYGLYDMCGNVYEACHDFWGDYSWGVAVDPSGPSEGEYYTMRGGSWGSNATYLYSACRYFFDAPDYYFYFTGFRTVRNAQ